MSADVSEPSSEPRYLLAGPLAGVLTGLILWGLEAPRLLENSDAGYAATLRAALWLGASGVIAGVVVTLGVSLVGGTKAFFARRRLVLAGAAALAALPLGVSLGGGSGLARAGLSWLPPLLLPLVAAGGLLVALAFARRLRKPRLLGALFVVVAILLRLANARLFVGLYAPIHDALFLVETLFLAMGLRALIGPRREVGPSLYNPLAFISGVLVLVFGMTYFVGWAPPREGVRAAMGRSGFHTPRFLRWRPQGNVDSGLRDDGLERGLLRWQSLTREDPSLADDDQNWNLVWISVDTLRADRCGFMPGSVRRNGKSLTPNLDALAAQSAVFERAYSPYPSTHLSAEAAFTGRYPRGTALYRRLTANDLASDTPVARLPAVMRDSGLAPTATIAFTKEWMAHPAFAEKLDDFELVNFKRPGGPSLDARHFVTSARETLTALGDRRFFLWFHVFEPHAPYEPQPDFDFGSSAKDLYDAEVAYADRQVGELLKELETRGLRERTVIVFSSDHGEALGEKGIRYHGSALSEVQLRVPMIVSVPGIPPTRRSELVSLVDLYPTAIRLVGAEPPTNQGRDLSPLIASDDVRAADYPDFAYAELPDDVKELSAASSNVVMLRRGPNKLLRYLAEGYGEVFNVEVDPEETAPLTSLPDEVKWQLEAELAGFADFTRDFGRAANAPAERARERRALVARLAPDGEGRLGALHELGRTDAAGWSLAEDRVLEIVGDANEPAPMRRAALHLLVARSHPEAAASCQKLAADPHGMLRWAALRESWRLEALPAFDGLTEDTVPAVAREAMLIACARGDGGRNEARRASVRAWSQSPELDPATRHRALFALALAGDDRLEADRLLSETWDLSEAHRIMRALEAQRHPLASVLVERLVRDRYLYPELRSSILRDVPAMDEGRALRIGRHLLAGWDPSFHERATEVYTKRFGREITAALGRVHLLESECKALAKKQSWSDLAEAYRRVVEARPPGDFDDLVLDAVRAELAAGNFAEAAKTLSDRDENRGDQNGDDLRRRRAWAELRAAKLAEGEMLPEEKIRVLSVLPEAGARRFVLPQRTLGLRVRVSNESRRALPGGSWPRTGRLRVLWFRDDAQKATYGTEVAMTRGLMPGETEDRTIHVVAPAEPGVYRGRIIITQHRGARFFRHEDPALCEFRLQVLGPKELAAKLELNGAEIALNLLAPSEAESWGSLADGSLEAVITSPSVGVVIGPVPWSANKGVAAQGRAATAGEVADLVLTLRTEAGSVEGRLPLDDQEAFRPLASEASPAVLEVSLGERTGVLMLQRLVLGPR